MKKEMRIASEKKVAQQTELSIGKTYSGDKLENLRYDIEYPEDASGKPWKNLSEREYVLSNVEGNEEYIVLDVGNDNYRILRRIAKKIAQQNIDQLTEIANYFFSLPEENLRQLTALQEMISQMSSNPDADPAVQSFTGAAHGYLDDTKSFVRSLGIVIGKLRGVMSSPIQNQAPLAATPAENQQLYARRIAQVGGEEDKEKELDPIFKKKWDSPLAPGTVYQSAEPLSRDKSVGSQYSPAFIAEDMIRRTRSGHTIGSPYQSIKEAYDTEIETDENLSKEQKAEIKAELGRMGYPVK